MKYYFRLQYLSIKRSVEAAGLPFYVGIIVLAVLYSLLFYSGKLSPNPTALVLVFVQYSAVNGISGQSKVDFLKQLFPDRRYVLVQLIEYAVITIPLLIITWYYSFWIAMMALLVLPILYAKMAGVTSNWPTVPTPFSRRPFEFIVLFRRFWFVLLILYIIFGLGLHYENENLVFVIIIIHGVITLSAYDVIEDELWIWNYVVSPQRFLAHKCTRGIGQCLLLCAPIVVFACIAYPDIYWKVALLMIGVFLFIVLHIFLKYSIYPRRAGITEVLIFVSAVLTLFLIPYLYYYYYKKSVQNLKSYL